MSTPIATAEELVRKHCVPCEGGVPKLSLDEANGFLANVAGWSLTHEGTRIRRDWVAKNFLAGMDFLNELAKLAEAEGHHPDIQLFGYRNVAVEVYTHAIGGLSENDFILAAKINELPIKVKSH